MRLIYLVLINLLTCAITGQHKYDNTWVLGYDYTDDSTGFRDAAEGMVMNFDDSISLKLNPIPYEMLSSCAVSHPETGKLMFYTNGCSIINADHQIMSGGDSLNYSEYWRLRCTNGSFSFHGDSNATIALPDYYNNGQYYLVHRTSELTERPYKVLLNSKIDMNQENGKGRVLYKNKLVRNIDQMAWLNITACKHNNGRDWWVVAVERYKPIYHVIRIDENGLSYSHRDTVGQVGPSRAGQSVFSPDGRTFMWHDLDTGVMALDFDRSTGHFSRPRFTVLIPRYLYGRGGVTISPNSRYAYVSALNELFQLDLWHDDLNNGKLRLDSINYITPFGIGLDYSKSTLGPDCRIYISTGFTWETLHIIHQPDEGGLACQLEPMAYTLPFPNSNSAVPNNPHYRMGTGSVCTPRQTNTVDNIVHYNITIHPNPTSYYINVDGASDGSLFLVYDLSGRLILKTGLSSDHQKVDLSELEPSIYIAQVRDGEGNVIHTQRIAKL